MCLRAGEPTFQLGPAGRRQLKEGSRPIWIQHALQLSPGHPSAPDSAVRHPCHLLLPPPTSRHVPVPRQQGLRRDLSFKVLVRAGVKTIETRSVILALLWWFIKGCCAPHHAWHAAPPLWHESQKLNPSATSESLCAQQIDQRWIHKQSPSSTLPSIPRFQTRSSLRQAAPQSLR